MQAVTYGKALAQVAMQVVVFLGALNLPAANATGFEFTVNSVALRPATGNLDIGVQNLNSSAAAQSLHVQTLQPNYHFSFGLAGRYVFQLPDQDLLFEWLHFSRGDANHPSGQKGTIHPFYALSSTGGFMMQARGDENIKYDRFNVALGHRSPLNASVMIKIFAGLSTVRVSELLTGFYSGPNQRSVVTKNDAKYWGVGPRLGGEGTLPLGYEVRLITQMALSLLTGWQNAKTTYHWFQGEITQDSTAIKALSIHSDQTLRLSPALDAKIGIRYDHSFGRQSKFKIELGYQGAGYLNMIKFYHPTVTSGDVTSDAWMLSAMDKTEMGFEQNGPYLAITIKI